MESLKLHSPLFDIFSLVIYISLYNCHMYSFSMYNSINPDHLIIMSMIWSSSLLGIFGVSIQKANLYIYVIDQLLLCFICLKLQTKLYTINSSFLKQKFSSLLKFLLCCCSQCLCHDQWSCSVVLCDIKNNSFFSMNTKRKVFSEGNIVITHR